jgi:VIT1/CCC1 family predicted Fe2+/Mn2+ transporter/rubrerythrin
MGAKIEETIRAIEQNWRAEKHSAHVYRDLSEAELNPRKKAILLRLAEAEERHAGCWEKKLAEYGASPELRNGFRRSLSRWFNRHAGAEAVIQLQEAAENRNGARYEQQSEAAGGDTESGRIARRIALEERAHARMLKQMAPHLGPRTTLDVILRRERWHGRGGSWVADAIYGVNDGLGGVFGLVSGVAGATHNQHHLVLISGLAGMVASTLSMGAGAWLAVKSEREIYEAEIAREKDEVQENPAEEIEEMALFYELQGFEPVDARAMAERLAKNPEQMVLAMAQSELGLSEQRFPKPWVSSFWAAFSTGVGAFIPIVPFFFMTGFAAVIAAFIVSIIAHFAVGAAKALITTRSWWASGFEMTWVGILEAVVTYALGVAVGGIG